MCNLKKKNYIIFGFKKRYIGGSHPELLQKQIQRFCLGIVFTSKALFLFLSQNHHWSK